MDEVLEDIDRARRLDEFMLERGIGIPSITESDYARVDSIAMEIESAQREAGMKVSPPIHEYESLDDIDPRMAWFLSWFNIRPDLAECMRHILSWRHSGGRTCFLGDADAFILKPDFFTRVMDAIRAAFPSLTRFTVYGRTATAARLRSPRELAQLARAGLTRVHFGIESGSDRVLAMTAKGVTAAEHIEGCLKAKDAGLSCSVYVMPGLGGSALSEEHAQETARVITSIGPDFVRLRTLEIFPSTPLETMARSGAFTEAPEDEVVREIRTFIDSINTETEIVSDSASNLLNIYGRVPDDRSRMLSECDTYLAMSKREKLEFSFHARLQSFIGQYGGLSNDIISELTPYVFQNRLDVSRIDNHTLRKLIRMVRSKLMP